MAIENPQVTATAVEASEFPDLVRRYRISGVPKTVVNDVNEILGALPEPVFVEQALRGMTGPEAPSSGQNPST